MSTFSTATTPSAARPSHARVALKVLGRFCRTQPLGALALALILTMLLAGSFAPQLAPYDPLSASFTAQFGPAVEVSLLSPRQGTRAAIEIRTNRSKNGDVQPDYRVYSEGVEIGAGWIRVSEASGKTYVSLSLAAPEFGPRRIYANLGRAAGQDDDRTYAILWNPVD